MPPELPGKRKKSPQKPLKVKTPSKINNPLKAKNKTKNIPK